VSIIKRREAKAQTVGELANALILAQGEGDAAARTTSGSSERGRAVFLVGAGCSASAGIPMAGGVAEICAEYLATRYSGGQGFTDSNEAIGWLKREGKIPAEHKLAKAADDRKWSELYAYFFEEHLRSANQQREIINRSIARGKGLNWAHACLGELVSKRFVHTVLTTNFDQLVLEGVIKTGIIPVVADNLDALDRVISAPVWPQVIHLHGSMHTYNLRNSKASLGETQEDPRFARAVTNLMHGSDVLVVVGYGGGEEGIMEVLCDAAEQNLQMVVYWVAHGGGYDSLSKQAQDLMSRGENKFVIASMNGADEFFWTLMEALKLGAPEWVGNPIGVMSSGADKLLDPSEGSSSFPNEAISLLINDYRRQIRQADENQTQSGPREKAAYLRAKGDFAGSNVILADLDLRQDLVASRLHALNMQSLFEIDPNNEAGLRSAITEFEELVKVCTGEDKFKNYLSLADAYYDLAELERSKTPDETDGARDKEEEAFASVVTLAADAQNTFTVESFPLEWARLELFKAQALHFPGERKGRESEEKLMASIDCYKKAIKVFEAHRDLRAEEARAGLAGALEARGSLVQDSVMIFEALGLHDELVDAATSRDNQTQLASYLYNRSGCLLALAKLQAHGGADELKRATESAEAAVRIFGEQNDAQWIPRAQERLADITTFGHAQA
jgi:NAD-dependent SIR2 family protein deacetylase